MRIRVKSGVLGRWIRLAGVLSVVSAAAYFTVGAVMAFSGTGAGNDGSPYRITTCSQLQEMQSNLSASYELGNDINCNGVTFTPIGSVPSPFTGKLFGNNYAISNLTISQPTTSYVGLFAAIAAAQVRDLDIVNASVTGGYSTGILAGRSGNMIIDSIRIISSDVSSGSGPVTGGLVGSIAASTVSNVLIDNDSTITGQNSTGGLAGYVMTSDLSGIGVEGTVTGNGNVGGILGFVTGNSLSDSYFDGTLTAEENIGGVIGYYDLSAANEQVDVRRVYSAGSLTAGAFSSTTGGIIGVINLDQDAASLPDPVLENIFSRIVITNNSPTPSGGVLGRLAYTSGNLTSLSGGYSDATNSGSQRCIGDGSITDCVKVNIASANPDYFTFPLNAPLSAWDFSSVWTQDTDLYPILRGNLRLYEKGIGSQTDPYQITDCQQLQAVAANLTSHFKVMNAIDCSASSSWNGGQGFAPIGNDLGVFGGTFNGNNQPISELYIDRVDDDPDTNYDTDPATNQQFVGLFGYAVNADISNVVLNNARIRGYQYVGGVVGLMEGGTVTNAKVNVGVADNSCDVNGSCIWARYGINGGGIVGYLDGGIVDQSISAGPVKGSGNVIGGLVGYMQGSAVLSDSRTSSNVDGGSAIGGAVGRAIDSTIDNVFASGNVIAKTTDEFSKPGYSAGGLVAIAETSTIMQSAATGDVRSDDMYGGGLAAVMYRTTVTDTYATGDVSVGNDYAGGFAAQIVEGSVSRSYSSGDVSLDNGTVVGGFASYLTGSDGNELTISDSFTTSRVTGSLDPLTYAFGSNVDPVYVIFDNISYDQQLTQASYCTLDNLPTGCSPANADALSPGYFTHFDNSPFTQSTVGVWNPLLWYFDEQHLPILFQSSTAPILITPAAYNVYKDLPIHVYMPFDSIANSNVLVLQNDSRTIVIGLQTLAPGHHQFTIPMDSILSTPEVTSSTSLSIPTDAYTITIAGQPTVGGPAVSAIANSVTITDQPYIICEAPSRTDTTVRVACAAVPNEGFGTATWQMQYSADGGATYTSVTLDNPAVAIHTITGLQPGTQYVVRFRFTNDWGTSEWGSQSVKTLGTAPSSGSSAATPDTNSKSKNVTIVTKSEYSQVTSPAKDDVGVPATGDEIMQMKAGTGSDGQKTSTLGWWWIVLIIVPGAVLFYVFVRWLYRHKN